jgi:hypothetical protein
MNRLVRHRHLLALAIGLAGTLTWLCWQPAGRAVGFGRWQSRAIQCSFHGSPSGRAASSAPRRCHVVRLEQNLEGLLSVRFMADGSGPKPGAEHLLFAGVLDSGQRPMDCNPDGRCLPRWPTRVVVTTIAATSFNERGLANTLPQALLAKGTCQVNRSVVRCQAMNDSGQRWNAEAQL